MSCIVCGRDRLADHEPQTCVHCLGQTRRDLSTILELVALGAVILDGWPARSPSAPSDAPTSSERPLLVGELGVILGPGSYGRSAAGRATPDNAATHNDPIPIEWVLCSWEDDWRETRGDPAAVGNPRQALANAARYLDQRAPWAAQHHPAFDEYAHDLAKARRGLEAALRAGPDRSPVPCITCGRRRLERPDQAYGGIEWRCTRCHRGYTESEFWQAVRAYGQPV